METTLTKARQITLSAKIIRKFGLSPGSKLRLFLTKDGILLIPERNSFKDLAGVVRVERWEDAEEIIEKEREKDLAH